MLNSDFDQPESSPATTTTIGVGLEGGKAGHLFSGDDMDFKTFDELVERETKRMKDVMCSKSADYSADNDKLFNFKLAAEVDGVSPIEALRGMWLKHRTSLRQGLDELVNGKCRPKDWWIEKLTDDRNYSILLQALLTEKYFQPFVCPAGWTIELNEHGVSRNGWYVIAPNYLNLHKDLTLHNTTGRGSYKYGEAPGYWPTKEAAEDALKQYLGRKTHEQIFNLRIS